MKTWETRKTVGALAVAAAIAAFGGSAIAAAADGGFHRFHAGSGGMHGGGGQPIAAPPHRNDQEPEALHDEKVVADGHGGFQTLLAQTGRVSAISATSVTARSDDGFVQTYVIHQLDPAAAPPFHVDDQVTITGTREGEAAVLSTIRPPLFAGH